MLFKIEGSLSYLLGSFHFTINGFELPPSWKAAYRSTNRLVLEARLDETSTVH